MQITSREFDDSGMVTPRSYEIFTEPISKKSHNTSDGCVNLYDRERLIRGVFVETQVHV